MAKISSVINKIRQWANKLLALPLYPIALAWYVILFLYLHNVEELTIGVTRTPLIVSFVAIAAATCAAYIWFRNWSKSALIIVLLLVFLYFYEPVFQTASSLLAAIGVHARQGWILIGLFGLLVALLSWQLRRWAGDIAKLTSVINVVSLLLVGITVVQIIPHEAQRLTSENLGVDKQAISEIVNLKSTQKPSQLPDVYYIIFDKYASNQSLKDYYDFDNQQLATALEERGFYVASDARTNYPSTIFSLSSSLNMNYIQDVVNMSDPSLSRGTTLKWLLSHNAVGKLFQKQGYTYYHLGNWYDLTRRVEVADSNLLYEDEISQQNFIAELLGQSIFVRLADVEPGTSVAASSLSQRQIIEYQLKEVRNIPAQSGPAFTVAHVLLPHDPYVYDATCKPITLMDVSISTPQQYIDHVQCANILLLNLIDDILESSENPPIIIFQSDEGSRPYNGQKSGKSLYDFADATDDYLLERTGIQNAYFFPDQNYAELYQGISPVNTFRTIFRQYFNIDTPNLEDKTYVFPNDDEMFNFIDATERINNLSTP